MSEKRKRDGVIRDHGLECEFVVMRPHARVEGVFLVDTAIGQNWVWESVMHFDAQPSNLPQGQKGER